MSKGLNMLLRLRLRIDFVYGSPKAVGAENNSPLEE